MFVERKKEEMKHRMEWCAEADGYRCMRCGRGSNHEDARKMHRTKTIVKKFGNMGKTSFGRSCHDLVRRMDRQGQVLIWCRSFGKMLKRIQVLEDGGSLQRRLKTGR